MINEYVCIFTTLNLKQIVVSIQRCHEYIVKHTAHDDVIKWKHFPRYWPFVWGIYWPPVNFPHEGQWRGALVFSLIGAWINDWVNNREAGDLWCHRTHYDVTIVTYRCFMINLHVSVRGFPLRWSDPNTQNSDSPAAWIPSLKRPLVTLLPLDKMAVILGRRQVQMHILEWKW